MIVKNINKAIFASVLSLMSCDQGQELMSDTVAINAKLSEVTTYDVTMLYPLVNDAIRPFMLRPNSVSKVDAKPIVPFTQDIFANDTETAYVYGLRIDPCFPGGVVTACEPQVRLSLQASNFQGLSAVDTSFHVFYKFTAAELKELVLEIVSLRKSLGINTADTQILKVHPGLAAENPVFAKGLIEILLKRLTQKKVIRITKAFGERNSQWSFKGFDVKGGRLVPMKIKGLEDPGFGNTSVMFRFSQQFGGTFEPGVSAQDDLSFVALTPKNQMNTANKVQVTSAVSAAFKIENPKTHTPETTDCVSCHIARQVINQGMAVLAGQNFSSVEYKNTTGINSQMAYPLVDFTNVRAFGYSGQDPVISQRVINETVESVKYLRAQR